ncbi:MAG: ribonuclease P protein component [Bacteroidetes bacterium]|nr:ribonuclease P protein component [Bacteroidota bacterium]
MNQKGRHTFSREERLKSRKLIGMLFREGKAVNAFPLRMIWMEISAEKAQAPIQFTVSVPKRRFKRAVDRNRLKRQVREAFRLRKAEILESIPEEKAYALMIIFTGPEKMSYRRIDRSLEKGLKKWFRVIEGKQP